MSLKRNRREGGQDPFSERPQLTPEQAANAAYGMFSAVDLSRGRTLPVPIELIVEDPEIQVRIGKLRQSAVEAYAAVLMNGGRFDEDPVLFTESLEADNQTFAPPFILSDGWHRKASHLLAYELTGDQRFLTVRATVYYREDAWEAARTYAESANLTHGLQLSNKEKQRVLARRVLRGHDWYRLSNTAVAKELGVARTTVQNWLVEIAKRHPDNEWARYAANKDVVVGADGREYNTGEMGDAQPAHNRKQKSARVAVRNLDDTLARLDRLGYPMDHPMISTLNELIQVLRQDFEIDDP